MGIRFSSINMSDNVRATPEHRQEHTMTAETLLNELQGLGQDSYRKILLKHGACEPCYGVKIEELKKLHKRLKTDHALALALYDSGVYDAMYLAGLVADDARMTRADLQRWAKKGVRAPGWFHGGVGRRRQPARLGTGAGMDRLETRTRRRRRVGDVDRALLLPEPTPNSISPRSSNSLDACKRPSTKPRTPCAPR